MSIIERIQMLCDKKGTTLIGLEREIGLGRGTIRNWNKSSPSIDKVQKIADYFHVPIAYLTGEENDEKDIARTMDKIKRQLLTEQGLMFDGEILDEETANLLLEEIERQERIVKAVNKKYTPKKYR